MTGAGIASKSEDALDKALFNAVEGMKTTLLGLRVEGYMTLGDALKRSGGNWESKIEDFVNRNLAFDEEDIDIEENDKGYLIKMRVRISLTGGLGVEEMPSIGETMSAGMLFQGVRRLCREERW